MHHLVVIVAKYFIVISALVTLAVLAKLKRPQQMRLIATIVIGGIITYLLAKIGAHFYYDPRPFIAGHFTPYFNHANDNGFPSDHTLLAGLLAFSAWKYSRKATYLLLILAIMIGGARVIAGVHHSADIAGALVCALVGVAIAGYLVKRFAPSDVLPKKSSPSPLKSD